MSAKKILLVDDEKMNIAILQEILSPEFELRVAKSGEEALPLASSFHPDIVLLDIMLPGIDGYQVCRKLKNSETQRFTKVILISAKTSLSERLAGYESGADDYLAKPFDPEELLAKVRVFLRLKSAEEIRTEKETLLNLFSHESRTPLNSIVGFAKLLLSNEKLSAQGAESASHILNSGIQLQEFVEKIIILDELKSGARKPNFRNFQIGALLDKILDTHAVPLKKRRIKTRLDGLSESSEIRADEDLLNFSLSCMLINSIIHSPEKSQIEICAAKSGSKLSISVRDQGQGLKNSGDSCIFNEFNVPDLNHHGKGHGLSLPIMKKIAELHGGDLHASNNCDGPGCTFSLSIPQNF